MGFVYGLPNLAAQPATQTLKKKAYNKKAMPFEEQILYFIISLNI